jgi:hypothetical protein
VKETLEQRQASNFHDGTLAAAVDVLANDQTDPIAQSCLFEAAARLRWAVAELTRRDRNELRNCINWGPCSQNDGGMTEDPTSPPRRPYCGQCDGTGYAPRDSGSGPKGENSRSEVEGEAPQSGLPQEGIARTPLSKDSPS